MRTLAAALLLTVACSEVEQRPRPGEAAALTSSSPAARASAPDAAWEQCKARIVEVLKTGKKLSVAPDFEQHRAALTAEHDLEPILWRRQLEPAATASRSVRAYREQLRSSAYPGDLLRSIWPALSSSRSSARAAFLRENMIYAQRPALARELLRRLRPRHLFEAPELVIERRGTEHRALRGKDGRYRWKAGEQRGREVRFELFDRVIPANEQLPPRPFLSLSGLAEKHGFTRLQLLGHTENRIVVELRYGDGSARSRALIDTQGPAILCEHSDDRAAVTAAKQRARTRQLALRHLEAAMDEQARLRLPFDEPETEEGQQDGALRNAWLEAYEHGRTSYLFNGDRYQVFDEHGQPRPPQVCIDFITETLERASGTHFEPRTPGGKPGRAVGLIDFDELLGGTRRQVAAFVELAHRDPEHFSARDIRPGRWVPFAKQDRFYQNLAELSVYMQRGDVLVIRGLVPWDRKRRDHYHSFFVREVDSITGVVTKITGNALLPRTVSWRQEMQRAPKRSLRHIVHLNTSWLSQAFQPQRRDHPQAKPDGNDSHAPHPSQESAPR